MPPPAGPNSRAATTTGKDLKVISRFPVLIVNVMLKST